MAEAEQLNESPGLNKTRLVAATLSVGGLLCQVSTLIWALARYVELSRLEATPLPEFFGVTALLFAGIALGLLLWGIAELLRKLDARVEATADLAGMVHRQGSAGGDRSAADEELRRALQQLVELTREVRDIGMLSQEQRSARQREEGRALLTALQESIPALLQEHNWLEARARVQRARERFPGLKEWDELDAQIESLREKLEVRDVEAAARQVEDLASLGAWDRAAGVVRELLERHPTSPRAQQLAARVRAERDKEDAAHRARLMATAQEAVDQREWNRALTVAQEVVRRYPNTMEADALQQQIPTLEANVEIQTRQRMESDFRDLMKQSRFEAALQLAHDLIERYPKSPQAAVLREQLPRLQAKVARR